MMAGILGWGEGEMGDMASLSCCSFPGREITFPTQTRVEKLVSAIAGSTSGGSVTISANFHYFL